MKSGNREGGNWFAAAGEKENFRASLPKGAPRSEGEWSESSRLANAGTLNDKNAAQLEKKRRRWREGESERFNQEQRLRTCGGKGVIRGGARSSFG